MNQTKFMFALNKIAEPLRPVTNALDVKHSFSKLLEEHFRLDIAKTRDDAWISANQAIEMTSDPNHGTEDLEFEIKAANSGPKAAQQWLLERMIAKINEVHKFMEPIRPLLFSQTLHEGGKTAWEKKEADEEVRPTLEKIDEASNLLKDTPELREWARANRQTARGRKKFLEGEPTPQEEACQQFLEIEENLKKASNECNNLLNQVTGVRKKS